MSSAVAVSPPTIAVKPSWPRAARRSNTWLCDLTEASVTYCFSSFGLRVDRVGRRAWLGQRELVITPKGFTLLEYLMVHKDELIERSRLLEVLWGFEEAVGTRAVDSRVAELRRVLGEDAAEPRWIATVQGRGYRFVGEVRGEDGQRRL